MLGFFPKYFSNTAITLFIISLITLGSFFIGCLKTETEVPITMDISATSLDFQASGGEQSFSIESNTKNWSVNSNASTWLTASPTSGSSNNTIRVTAQANTSSSQRTGTVTINGVGVTRSVSVTQAGISASRGSITFWTDKNYCGTISVTLTGQGTRTITGYFPSGIPECGANGTATFTNVPYGTYNFNASCTSHSWSGSITLSHSCYTMLLYVQ